ncbi:hypothetical protein [Streptomyces sp. NRRL S-1824]|uniref:hypothetical protein n=1 Tax=Streptomyces sp. NRRL S-1824 TaxID=1463889 RepID=UPI0006893287|nr:hypothetical protein [Streptomyces sp. NRRL S-1824]
MTGNVATGILGVESTALCSPGDVAVGGGYNSNAITINVTQNAPVFTGSGPATGWQTSATVGLITDSLTSFAICHFEA